MHKQRKKTDVKAIRKMIRVRPEDLAEVTGGDVKCAVDCATVNGDALKNSL